MYAVKTDFELGLGVVGAQKLTVLFSLSSSSARLDTECELNCLEDFLNGKIPCVTLVNVAIALAGDVVVLNDDKGTTDADVARLATACLRIGEGLNWAARTGF